MNRYLAALGLCTTTLAAPALAEDRSPSDLPITVQMNTLRDVGTLDEQLAMVEAASMQLACHNHDFEMVKYDGKTAHLR